MENISCLPKGPSENKLFQAIRLIQKTIPYLEECQRNFGHIFTLRIFGRPNAVVISDLMDLKQVFSANANQLNTGEVYATLMGPVIGEGSLFSLDGQKHIRHRKLLLPPFHGRCMQAYGDLMAKIVKDKASSWKAGDAFTLSNELHDITFGIIFSAIFGMNEKNMRFERLKKSLRLLIHSFATPFAHFTLLTPRLHRNLGPLTPWANIMKLRQAVNKCLSEEIEERRKSDLSTRIDILSLLLQAKDEAGSFLTTEEICDEMLTLLIAGHDTTTMSACWAFYGVLSNPNVYQKLKDELNHVFNIEGGLIANLDKLIYLDAVVKEALRVTPVIPLAVRLTNEEYQLREYTLPKGTAILPCIYLAHRDPKIWAEPDKFMPERFLNSATVPFTYLPFGSGIRRCIGAAFAHHEIKIILAQIFLHAELGLKENYKPKMKMRGVVAAPSGGVPVVIKKILTI